MFPPLADRAHHDDAHAHIRVERLECEAKLVALGHRDDIVRRPVEDDVTSFMTFVELHLEAVELDETWICERIA